MAPIYSFIWSLRIVVVGANTVGRGTSRSLGNILLIVDGVGEQLQEWKVLVGPPTREAQSS